MRGAAVLLVPLILAFTPAPAISAPLSSDSVRAGLSAAAEVDFTSARDLMRLRQGLGQDGDFALGAMANGLVPGSAILADGDRGVGLAYLGAGAALLTAALVANQRRNGESFRNNCLVLYQNVGFLSAWDGYYRALAKRSEAARRALEERPSLPSYLLSPFDPRRLVSWEAGPPLALALTAVGADRSRATGRPPDPNAAIGVESLILAQTTFIGSGEELLFRGVVLPELRNWVGSDNQALLAQAVVFGMGHLDPRASGRDNVEHFAFATTFGLYTGWVALHRPQGLRKTITLHAWWDFIALSADYLKNGKADPIVVRLRF